MSEHTDKAGDGMATCVGGQFAVCVDEKSPTYGWVHQRHPDGQWVTVRKATDDEITRGKAAYELRAGTFGSLLSAAPALLLLPT
jgi:hypothetical protein